MKYGGIAFSVFLVDGYNLASAQIESAVMGKENLTQQTNPFGVGSDEHTPIGIDKGVLQSAGGLYDTVTDALHSALGAVVGIRRVVSAAVFGNVIGKPFIGYEGVYSQKYDVMGMRDGLTKANVTYIVSGKVEEGQIIQDLAAYTANWDTKTGGAGAVDAPVDFGVYDGNGPIAIASNSIAAASVVTTPYPHGLVSGQTVVISGVTLSTPTINGSRVVTVLSSTTFSVPVTTSVAGVGGAIAVTQTNSGGAGYVQATAMSGFSNVAVKIMHSPDDITYATLVTFTGITVAPAKERIAVAGLVDRYLSSNGVVTGAGSITVFSGFSRY